MPDSTRDYRREAEIAKSGSAIDAADKAAAALEKKVGALDGVLVEVAGALRYDFREGKYDQSQRTAAGVWGVLGYRGVFDTVGLELLGLARYLWTRPLDAPTPEEKSLDLGFRAAIDSGDFVLRFEQIWRRGRGEGDPDSERAVFGVDYRVTAKTSLSASFGRDFLPSGAPGEDEPLIALLALRYGMILPSVDAQ